MLCLLGFVVMLSANLTYLWPIGGNDEPMHLSMSRYIARHLEWPRWDSEDIERYFGISYATSPTLNYWFDGLILRWTGYDRASQVLLFCVCLGVFAHFTRRNGLAGLFACAVIVPQVVFVFSYVNSDAWTATVALLLGVAVDAFLSDPLRTRNIFALFVTAAACLTCRYHLWAVGFLAFMFALLPRLRLVWSQKRRELFAALALSLVVAAWWPVTSYRANDGDLTGFRAATSERLVFAQPNNPEFMAMIPKFTLADFFERMLKSFYGWWGWATIALPWFYYKSALLLALPLFLFALLRHYDRLGLFFVVAGVLVHREAWRPRMQQTWKMGWFVAAWAVIVIGFNIAATSELYARSIRAAIREANAPVHRRAQMMLQTGYRDSAKRLFEEAIDVDPEDFHAHNALGYMLMLEGDFAGARIHLETAKQLEPLDTQIRLNLGILRLKEGKPDDAVREFNEALKFDRKSPLLYYYLSVAYGQTGDLGRAIKNCQRALQINPTDLLARERLKTLLEQALQSAGTNQ
jgi:tetratricopeptide (TPR) repeat protein